MSHSMLFRHAGNPNIEERYISSYKTQYGNVPISASGSLKVHRKDIYRTTSMDSYKSPTIKPYDTPRTTPFALNPRSPHQFSPTKSVSRTTNPENNDVYEESDPPSNTYLSNFVVNELSRNERERSESNSKSVNEQSQSQQHLQTQLFSQSQQPNNSTLKMQHNKKSNSMANTWNSVQHQLNLRKD